MVAVFIKTIIQSEMLNATTMIPCRHVSKRELTINPRQRGLPYKEDRGTRRKLCKETLRGAKSLLCGRGLIFFSPLRGTNSKATHYLTPTFFSSLHLPRKLLLLDPTYHPTKSKVPDEYCANEHKPRSKRSCNKKRRCGEWEIGLWSEVSL